MAFRIFSANCIFNSCGHFVEFPPLDLNGLQKVFDFHPNTIIRASEMNKIISLNLKLSPYYLLLVIAKFESIVSKKMSANDIYISVRKRGIGLFIHFSFEFWKMCLFFPFVLISNGNKTINLLLLQMQLLLEK